MTYTHKEGMIYDPEDGQTIATMSNSATPEQAALLAAAPELLAFAQGFLKDYQSEDGMASMKHYARAAQAATAKAGQEPTA